MSPRAVGATQHELSRIGLLATLPGETLARLAQRMTREDIPAGSGVVDAAAGRVEAAVDGEPAVLPTPIEFRIDPQALRVLVPDGG